MSNYEGIEFNKELAVTPTPIDGLLVVDLNVRDDNRGWFKENWQKEKMVALGLPEDFEPVQNNISYNTMRGATRGLHAEPWNKFVSIGKGRIFGAWCDLREGSATFGQSFTAELDASKAIFVPRGVANGFQTLEDDTVYTYLVDDHWSEGGEYSFVNLADETLAIDWPIPLSEAEMSDKDKNHPRLADVTPLPPKKVLITGASGQLGKALLELYPDAECVDRDTFDIADESVLTARRWKDYGLILNAAAYTAVDVAETPEGRVEAWRANNVGVANLAKIALANNITLVHVSSDYVFDGTVSPHTEDEPFSPLSVYGQTKAAGDTAASIAPKHYVVRTSWVVGDGNNFVRVMLDLAKKGIGPKVVDDQIGRLTFTEDLAAGIKHLVDSKAPFGTYNLSNEGGPVSWYDIASEIYDAAYERKNVTPVSTEQYYAGKEGIAPRPRKSTLDLSKIKATGFTPRDWHEALKEYLEKNNG